MHAGMPLNIPFRVAIQTGLTGYHLPLRQTVILLDRPDHTTLSREP